jgi:hypothetical protein
MQLKRGYVVAGEAPDHPRGHNPAYLEKPLP